jgi:hypothetical protein
MQSGSCEPPERRGKNRMLTVCLGAQRPMQRYSTAQKRDCTVHRNDKIRIEKFDPLPTCSKKKKYNWRNPILTRASFSIQM